MPPRKGNGVGLTACVDHGVGRLNAGGHGGRHEQQGALGGVAVGVRLIDLDWFT